MRKDGIPKYGIKTARAAQQRTKPVVPAVHIPAPRTALAQMAQMALRTSLERIDAINEHYTELDTE